MSDDGKDCGDSSVVAVTDVSKKTNEYSFGVGWTEAVAGKAARRGAE